MFLTMVWRLAILVLVLEVSPLGQNNSKTPQLQKNVESSEVQCSEKALVGKSDVVISPNGTRAYVALHGYVAPNQKEEDRQCKIEFFLHIAEKGSNHFVAIKLGEREDNWYYENRAEIVGWSADGEKLLMAMVTVGGDWDETISVVYDGSQKRFWRVNMTPLFKQRVPDDCLLYFIPEGFASDN
jgi:hypothetical protein